MLLLLVEGCNHNLVSTANLAGQKTIEGIYNSTSIPEDSAQREFLYFDGRGIVYYLTDTAFSSAKQKQRLTKYASKTSVSIIADSVFFRLDSFYIGRSTFSATVFNGKKIIGEEKIYYHNLMQKYSGSIQNDTLKFNRLSVSMRKDTTYRTVKFVRYIGN